jgi:hypothetical protein
MIYLSVLGYRTKKSDRLAQELLANKFDQDLAGEDHDQAQFVGSRDLMKNALIINPPHSLRRLA